MYSDLYHFIIKSLDFFFALVADFQRFFTYFVLFACTSMCACIHTNICMGTYVLGVQVHGK